MEAEEIRNLLIAQPFKPFEVHLSDNRSFVIEHPDFLMFTKDRSTIYIALDPDEDNNFRTSERIDLDHVVSVSENATRRPHRRRRKGA